MKKMYQAPKASWLDMDAELCQIQTVSVTDETGQPIDLHLGDPTSGATTGDISGARSPRSLWASEEE